MKPARLGKRVKSPILRAKELCPTVEHVCNAWLDDDDGEKYEARKFGTY